MNQRLGLIALNRANATNLPDVLRKIAGPDMPLGDLLNKLIAVANQETSSTAAAATVTIAGVAHAGDIIKLEVGDAVLVHTVQAAESTVTLIAAALKAEINADPKMSRLVSADNAAGVLTLTAALKGAGFNSTRLAVSVYGAGATTTATAQAATFGAATAGVGADSIRLIEAGDSGF